MYRQEILMKKMIGHLLCIFLLIHNTQAGKGAEKGPEKGHEKGAEKGPKKGPEALPSAHMKWLTLKGDEPVVAARGGLSGVFPEGSDFSFNVAAAVSLPGTLMYCDVQFSSDSKGFCLSSPNLQNLTTISDAFPNGQKTYNISGEEIQGWFALDYTYKTLIDKVGLVQNIHSRLSLMDGVSKIQNPMALSDAQIPFSMWINLENVMFYKQHKVDPSSYLEELMKKKPPAYISSTEIGFLKEIGNKKRKASAKLIFKFQQMDAVEPTTNEKYGSLLKKLSNIKSFASGILVPKEFIWPVDKARYLEPHTSLVSDAHKEGLEVHAYGFANDVPLSFNYSYDPVKEYLQYIDNSEFAVDGVLTDFSITASESVACLAGQSKNASRQTKILIITNNGASGDYPGSTDLAYQKAIDDGADVIDCSVQLSKDGVAFCMNSPDLTGPTTAVSIFPDKQTHIPEIQETSGIYSFDLTWSEIQTLKPRLRSPLDKDLNRNPKNKEKGKFVTLPEFLELARKTTSVGVLINVEYASYLAESKGLDLIKIVSTALSDAKFDKESSTRKVMIQSDDTAVLEEFKQYYRVLNFKEKLSGVAPEVPLEVKKHADAVTLLKHSVIRAYPDPVFLSKNFSNVIPAMHAANLSVFAGILRNEFQTFLFDFYADPYAELATLNLAGADGVITEFPATAAAYMNSPCSDLKHNLSYSILPVKPGDLYDHIFESGNPDFAMAPTSDPYINATDVVDPPLPPVAKVENPDSQPGSNTTASSAPASASSSAATYSVTANKAAVLISAIVGILCLLNVE